MIKLLTKLPRRVIVAVSGGVDSMAAWDFLSRNHEVSVAFFHHATETSEQAVKFVSQYCRDHSVPCYLGYLSGSRPRHQSPEEFWRIQRYEFLESLAAPVITAHHLDDCVETYVMSSLHGLAKTIPWRRNNIIRPFLFTPKSELESWCRRHAVPWCADPTNDSYDHMRNYVRHELVPRALHVNPGLRTMVRKKIMRNQQSDMQLLQTDSHS